MKLIVVAAVALLLAFLIGMGCYQGTPPCNPGSVDYPRCDPTQPAWGAHADGGQG